MPDYAQDARDAPAPETLAHREYRAARELACDRCPLPIAAGEVCPRPCR